MLLKSSAHIKEVNTGIMAMPTQHLKTWLTQLSNNNAQGEYYLTDIVEFAVQDQCRSRHRNYRR